MGDGSDRSGRARSGGVPDVAPDAALTPAARRLLAAVLALDADQARSVRAQAVRARPRRQSGPTVDLGD